MDLLTYIYQNIPEGWDELFRISKPEIKQISDLLEKEKVKYRIVPDQPNIFKVFNMCRPENIKVVIIGMDPYPQLLSNGKPRALGYSFSVSKEDAIPSSLQNIYKEVKNCYPKSIVPSHGDISEWVSQGVFLLNSCLTCRVGEPGSHTKYKLWLPFFDRFLKYLSSVNKDVIFVLWGNDAQKYESMIEKGFRNILKAVHPSGLSAMRGFIGCNHFKMINDILVKQNKKEIKWFEMEKELTELYVEYFAKNVEKSEMEQLTNYYKSYYDMLENKTVSLEEYTIYILTKTIYDNSSKSDSYEVYLKNIRERFEKEKVNFYQIANECKN